jgi:malate dehydrogenase (oxaloacetate-decarboxylating)(NADP+)
MFFSYINNILILFKNDNKKQFIKSTNKNNNNFSKENKKEYNYFLELFQSEQIYEQSRIYHMGIDKNHCSYKNNPGKFEMMSKKSMITQLDLSLAYSPGVAAPAYDISLDPEKIYDYTSKGNIVAVVTNGTAVLGLGDIGVQGSLPVMEGKSVLFKKFANIDSIPVLVNSKNVDEFINCVKLIHSSWGGINLEDIKSPECFEIEKRLQEELDIPVFHDDQHGTAIVAGAALLNALEITSQDISKMKLVMSGAGAAGIACLKFFVSLGIKKENIIVCDSHGVVFQGRTTYMDPLKSEFASSTNARSLLDAIDKANIFVGLSAPSILTEEMLLKMEKYPIIFAMANPEPEIKPEIAKKIRPDAIIATGRSDYPNQVNNVMGFPYIFRGALDVRAKKINEEMKIAAAKAIANLAKEPIHDNVFAAYSGRTFKYGPEYIIPTPFDPRLLEFVTTAVAKAAIDSGVARINIENFDLYKSVINENTDPTINLFQLLHEKVLKKQKTILFSEGEEERIIRAASVWVSGGYGSVILVGDKDKILKRMDEIGVIYDSKNINITNSAVHDKKEIDMFIEYYYKKMCRNGILKRDAARAVKTDRNIFSACMMVFKKADGMITGLTRNFNEALKDVCNICDYDNLIFGISGIITKSKKTIFISDTVVNYKPNVDQLVKITINTARIAKDIGYTPRVALVSHSSFGNSKILNLFNDNYNSNNTANHNLTDNNEASNIINTRDFDIRKAISILHSRKDVNFEVDGEIAIDVALNEDLLVSKYNFSKLKSPANVLIMPGIYSADISSKMLKSLTDSILVGPIIIGIKSPIQIISMDSSVSEIINMSVLTVSNILK